MAKYRKTVQGYAIKGSSKLSFRIDTKSKVKAYKDIKAMYPGYKVVIVEKRRGEKEKSY